MKDSDMNGVAPQIFGFDQLGDLFVEARSFTSPSQLHGLLCGQLSAGLRPTSENWLEIAASQMCCEDVLPPSVRGGLVEFYDFTLHELGCEELTFSPLLPDEDNTLAEQAEALGQWCSGFLSGFGLAGLAESAISEEASSALKDIAQISLVQTEELADNEETERDLFEICEYVRMVTLMLFNECQTETHSKDDTGINPNVSVH